VAMAGGADAGRRSTARARRSPMSEQRRVTLRDIAESLGLSVNTVSRALAGKDSVSEATRHTIRAEAQRVGYVPNSHARSLVLGATKTFGLVITNPSNPLYSSLISGIELRCRALGFTLVLLVSEESIDSERMAVESLIGSTVDGAIAVPVQGEVRHWDRLSESGIPLVFVNRDIPELEADFVGIDNEQGAYDATRHVIEAGARTIWTLEEDLPVTTISARIAGYHRAIADAGLPRSATRVISVPTRRHESMTLPWQPEEAYRVSQQLVDPVGGGELPDAFVVGNDYFALGLIRALHERRLGVPDDVLVIGYGDHPFANFFAPPLSSVALPGFEVGQAAVDVLTARRRDPASAPTKRLISPQLVARASTARTR